MSVSELCSTYRAQYIKFFHHFGKNCSIGVSYVFFIKCYLVISNFGFDDVTLVLLVI